MRDINTIYREEVAAANKEYTKDVGDSVTDLGEDLRKGMEIIRTGMEKFAGRITTAAQRHLEAVTSSEISWTTCAEKKMAQFQGVEQLQISDGDTKLPKTEQVDTPTVPPGTEIRDDDNDPVPSFLTRKRLPSTEPSR